MEDLETLSRGFLREVESVAGGALCSVVLYGSALTEDFRPGLSDYNFLIVADPIEMALLDRLSASMKGWRKKRIAVPLLLSPRFMQESIDSYPLEFLSIRARYQVLSGQDLLEAVQPRKEDVRLQCERELKSKLLLLRGGYVAAEGDPHRLHDLLIRGWPALSAILRGLLYIKDGSWDAFGEAFRAACGEHIGWPRPLLERLHEERHRKKTGRVELKADFASLIALLEDHALAVERW